MAKWSNNHYINNVLSIRQQLMSMGELPSGRTFFDWGSGDGLFFEKIEGGVYVGRYRPNGNGWHDVARLMGDELLPVGRLYTANPTEGLHRDTLRV